MDDVVTEFGILGPLRAVRDGHALDLGGARPRSLVARLLLAAGDVVGTDTLVDDVWLGRPPVTATKTLQKYVSELRKVLGPGVLETAGRGYVIPSAREHLDAVRFEALVAARDFDAALALWRGDVLADLPDAAFASAERTRLAELRLAAIEGRLRHELARGLHADVVAELGALVDEYPLREHLVGLHMLALFRAGRQVEALRAFERHRRRLAEEIGLSPAIELQELEGAILRQDPALFAARADELRRDADHAAAPSPVALPEAALRHRDRPFVGRHEPLAILRGAWQAAGRGRRRLVTVDGEAGVGKTRLAAHFAAAAHATGAVVLWGRATTGPAVPYEPIVTALTTVLHTVSPDARRRIVSGRSELTLLVPGLAKLVPAEHVPDLEIDAARYVLFETVAELLEAESAEWPLLFVLDDLQWADELSLLMIDHVLRHERAARLLLVATVRDLPVVANAVLDGFLADLRRDDLLTRVPLTGLDTADVAALLDAAGWDDAPDEARRIQRATAGNAFFVTELAERGPGEAPQAALPASLRDVLGRRLDQLDPPTARLVDVAAVAARSVPLTVLAGAGGLGTEELLDAVDAAIAAGVLAEEAGGGVTFKHALVQQAVLERLTAARRAATHLALADAFAAVDAPAAAEVAHHVVAAGSLAPRARAVDATVRAGWDALGALAYEEADRWAELASAASADVADELTAEALLLHAHSRRSLGQRVDARDAAMRAAEIARARGDGPLLARAAEAAALARAGLGFDFDTDDTDIQVMFDGARERLHLAGSAGGAGGFGGRTRDARSYPALAATAQLAWRMANWRRDLLEERIAADRAALADAERAGNAHLELNALLYGVTDLTESGNIEEAGTWFTRFRARGADVHLPVYDSFAASLEATRHLLRGEYGEAELLSEEALATGRSTHGRNATEAWIGNRLVSAWDHGTLPEFRDLIADAIADYSGQPTWQIFSAFALLLAGDSSPARAAMEQLVGDGRVDVRDDSLWGAGVCVLVEIARALDDRRTAALLAAALRPYAGRIVVCGLGRASLGPTARFAGVAASVAGDVGDGDVLLARAERQCRSLGARPHLARTLQDRARLLAGRERDGDGAAAERAMTEARQIADEIGMVLTDLDGAGVHR